MRTIKRHLPRNRPYGDYEVRCDLCGVTWYRSQMVKDRAGRLRCPDDAAGRDPVTLSELNAQAAAQASRRRSVPRDGGGYDSSDIYDSPSEVFGGLLEALYLTSSGLESDGSRWANTAPLTVGMHDMTQPSESARPAVVDGEVYCDGVDDYLITPRDFAFVTGQRCSLIWIGRYATLTPDENFRAVCMGRNNGDATNDQMYLGLFQRSTGAEYRVNHRYDDGTADGAGATQTVGPSLDLATHVHQIHSLSSGAVAYVDRQRYALGWSAGLGQPANGDSRLCLGASLSSSPADGVFSFGEHYTKAIAVLNGEPTVSQIARFTDWAMYEFLPIGADASGRLDRLP